MSSLFKVVASVLLTAAIAFGNCSMCIASSLAARGKQHACCKHKQVQPPCHKNAAPDTAQHQDGCSAQFAALEKAQTSERVPFMPLLVASAMVDAVATGHKADAGQSLTTEVDPPGLASFCSFCLPLRI
jgi:hypothetical protein